MIRFEMLAALLITLASAPAGAAPRDPHTEEANRSLVVEFYDAVFNKHELEKSVEVLAEDYQQHNPMVASGKQAFVLFFKDMLQKNPESSARILRSAADGDLVWLHVHVKANASDPGLVIVDIFRVKDGKLMEHWDVMQKYPEKAVNPML